MSKEASRVSKTWESQHSDQQQPTTLIFMPLLDVSDH